METKVKEKLELKHLAPYLPYGLKIYKTGVLTFPTLIGIEGEYIKTSEHKYKTENSKEIFTRPELLSDISISKPILRPLSDLTKEMENNAYMFDMTFIPLEEFLTPINEVNYSLDAFNQDKNWILKKGYEAIKCFPYEKVNILFELHFDVFGLIEKGLAIDINSINQ